MAMVSLREILSFAKENKYAVGAFDTMDHAFAEGILQAAEESGTPVILAAGEWSGPDYDNFYPYLVDRISRTRVPVCLHFDHGTSYEACAVAIRAGFSSVMIDGSALPFEENIRITRKVVELAHACGVDVEGEIGHVGSAAISESGVEDDSCYTEPEAAEKFVQCTGVDALAVAFGTSHGVYKQAPCLDFERLRQIAERVQIPLVMHGGSGLSDQDFKDSIENGICKINAYTNISLKVVKLIRQKAADLPPKTMSCEISDMMTKCVKEEVLRHIQLFETRKANK